MVNRKRSLPVTQFAAHRSIWFFLAIAFPSFACSLPGLMTAAPSVASGPMIVMAPPDSTATPTPFQPLPPTPVYLPTDAPVPTPLPELPTPTASFSTDIYKSWADYPGPSIWPDIEIPSPTGLLAQPEDQINILLLGSDQRPNDGGFRTDTILLLTLCPSLGTAHLTSFPRDLYVYIPGYTVQRINTAFAVGDIDLLALTMEYNFGVLPDHYALINLWSFKQVIDSLGGVDVNAALPFSDQRDGYPDPYGVPAGIVHMDGETALWYVRARYTTSDFDRGRRQAEVLQAAFVKLMSLDAISRAPQLFEIYRQNVITDLTFDDVAPLLPLAAQLADPSRLQRFAIGPGQVYNWVTSTGAQVLVPYRELVLEVMRQALNSP